MTVTSMPSRTRIPAASGERPAVARGHHDLREVALARRSSMCSSMSESMSLSSVTFGLANTAKPTLRSASTQGRTTSVLPGSRW